MVRYWFAVVTGVILWALWSTPCGSFFLILLYLKDKICFQNDYLCRSKATQVPARVPFLTTFSPVSPIWLYFPRHSACGPFFLMVFGLWWQHRIKQLTPLTIVQTQLIQLCNLPTLPSRDRGNLRAAGYREEGTRKLSALLPLQGWLWQFLS